MNNKLEHVAIIMDGNRRWANNHNLPKICGHEKGINVAELILQQSVKMSLKWLTLYTFSTENWQRPQDEVNSLINLLQNAIKTNINKFVEKNIKIKFVGSMSKFTPDFIDLLENCEQATAKCSGIQVNICLNYGGRQEIIGAIHNIIKNINIGNLKLEDLNQEVVSENLYTKGIPDPDLIIRTGGEIRLSNFLLWQSAYSELYFTDVLWPDFTVSHFLDAIENFNQRVRKYGTE